MKPIKMRRLVCVLSFAMAGALVATGWGVAAAESDAQPVPPIYQEVPTASGEANPSPAPPSETERNPAENQETIKDPLEPVNEKTFEVNQGLDEHAFHPIANAWIKVVPSPARKCISRFFDNAAVLPRFTNAVFQLRFKWAGSELARFGINSTIGVAGLFDPADTWFGLKKHDNNFAMTMARYGIGRGWYLMPPAGKPFDVRRAVGAAVDGLMNPMNYLVPGSAMLYSSLAHSVEALNARAESQSTLDDLHRFSIDEYGAMQDAYVQQQKNQEDTLRNPE